MAASAAEPPEVMVPTFELTVCPVVATEAVHELSVKWSFFVSARHGFLLCLLYHGSLVYLHHHGFLLCLFCHCPMLQVLFPFMGLALHPWTISVPPRLHHPGLLGFCSVWLRHLEPPLGGEGGGHVIWGFGVLSHVPVFMSLY